MLPIDPPNWQTSLPHNIHSHLPINGLVPHSSGSSGSTSAIQSLQCLQRQVANVAAAIPSLHARLEHCIHLARLIHYNASGFIVLNYLRRSACMPHWPRPCLLEITAFLEVIKHLISQTE